MLHGSEIIDDVLASVQAGEVRIDERYRTLAWTIGESRAARHVSPADSLRAAVVLFRVALTSLSRHVRDDPELMPCFLTAIQALDESISMRIREATIAYTEFLLERVHEAHIEERHRIARNLHDRLGEGMSAALRQLELHEIAYRIDPLTSGHRATIAKDALAEGMRRLRVATSDLRQDSVTNLEKALTSYISSISADTDTVVQLRVSGDEAWAPPTVIDEAFLIVREAIRNALSHAVPQIVRVRIALAPHQLDAFIEDDGSGFIPAASTDAPQADAGTGIASMRERAALLGGRLTIASGPGQGTRVELRVSLLGHRDEH
jgi:signal transduction histidine kinase